MMNFLKTSLLLLCVSLASGCTSFQTSNNYMSIKDAGPVVPEPGKALFIFERDNARVGEFTSLGVWEITDGNPRLVAWLHGTMKAAWSVDPGAHEFMITLQGGSQMMKAQVDAGKTYFVELNNNQWGREGPSAYKFCPVRKGTENPMTNTDIGTFDTSGEEQGAPHLESAARHIVKVNGYWNEYDDELKKRFTMNASDGR